MPPLQGIGCMVDTFVNILVSRTDHNRARASTAWDMNFHSAKTNHYIVNLDRSGWYLQHTASVDAAVQMRATREARDRIPEETRGMIQNTTRQRGLGMFKISPNFSAILLTLAVISERRYLHLSVLPWKPQSAFGCRKRD
jgi:hypothetical protein